MVKSTIKITASSKKAIIIGSSVKPRVPRVPIRKTKALVHKPKLIVPKHKVMLRTKDGNVAGQTRAVKQ
ncbi:hypothetical protein PCE1_004828 [Barthelona sp. PCE]